jgi:hypothetical protein
MANPVPGIFIASKAFPKALIRWSSCAALN